MGRFEEELRLIQWGHFFTRNTIIGLLKEPLKAETEGLMCSTWEFYM